MEQPGLIIAVTVSGTAPRFRDVRVDAIVDVNQHSKTRYSERVHVQLTNDVSEPTRAASREGRIWEEGRAAAISEMLARGDSLGPRKGKSLEWYCVCGSNNCDGFGRQRGHADGAESVTWGRR